MASSSIAGDTVYDFWEAVTCAKCHLRFVPDGGGPPLVPFWITECGHILCNNHLSGCTDNRSFFGLALTSNGLEDADQSCSNCGDRPINLAPLQREVSDDGRTACIFVWLLTCTDGTAHKRLVQITSLRNRFTRKLCQGSWFTSLRKPMLLIAVVQFQQATMGSLIKYYQEKIRKQRSIIEQCKKERAELIALRRCG